MNLQEQISRMKSMMGVISESIYSNNNINIGDIYEESDIYTYVQKLHHKRKEDFWEGDLGERIEKYPFYIVKEIPIEQIEMDEFQVDDDDVEEYVELFKKLNSYPPIVLTKKQYGYYYIIDGTHRANALRKLGLKSIICFVGKKKTQEMKEGELTEKCWPGYTQKGMKTMFGKRYPNCVKKTKK